MIKRVFITALLVLVTSLASFADEQKKIILNDNDHRTETVEFPYWNIFVSIKDIDDNDNVQIEVELENTDDSYNLYLFDRAYAVKELKKMKLSYDKGCPKSSIEACFDINSPIQLTPSQKTDLFVKTGNINAPIVFKLPIHIAKNRNKSKTKILLWDIVVVEIEIQVQLKPDTDYINIEESYNTLIREIDSEVFCTNKNHRGESLKVLKSKYEGTISDLKRTIKSIIDSREYYPSDKAYKKFMEVYGKLDKISIDEKSVNSCPKDRKPIPDRHKCKNCSLTYEQIYNKLADYYIKINIGKMKKVQVMSEVESLYTCASKNTKRSVNNSMRSRIITYYNKIKSL